MAPTRQTAYAVNPVMLFTRHSHSRQSWVQPFSTLPLEIVERILSFLPLEDLACARTWNRSFSALLQSPKSAPSIYISIKIGPPLNQPLPPLPALKFYLHAVSNLSLSSIADVLLSEILVHLPYQLHLECLDLSFTSTSTAILFPESVDTTVCYMSLRELNLKGCRHFLDASPLAYLPKLSVLDLSWSGVLNLLPLSSIPDISPYATLTCLSLASTSLLSPSPAVVGPIISRPTTPQRRILSTSVPVSSPPTLSPLEFLSALPSGLQKLDLSWMGLEERELDSISFSSASASYSTALEIDLRANERLTKRGIRRLEDRLKVNGVRVLKDPIMLESEEMADVRNFVFMLAGLSSR